MRVFLILQKIVAKTGQHFPRNSKEAFVRTDRGGWAVLGSLWAWYL